MLWRRFLHDQGGQDLVEYSLLLAFVSWRARRLL